MNSVANRFWSKVERKSRGECWPWLAATDRRGYGMIRVGGKHVIASRLAIELTQGKKIDPGMCACHTCDNPLCVNPGHLWIGTHKDNMVDCIKKGRGNKGLRNKAKTHCDSGHLFDAENTYITKDGFRSCRKCHAKWQAEYVEKRTRGGK